jgi:hypothetical protein
MQLKKSLREVFGWSLLVTLTVLACNAARATF